MPATCPASAEVNPPIVHIFRKVYQKPRFYIIIEPAQFADEMDKLEEVNLTGA
jgi:hypothetical protein